MNKIGYLHICITEIKGLNKRICTIVLVVLLLLVLWCSTHYYQLKEQ